MASDLTSQQWLDLVTQQETALGVCRSNLESSATRTTQVAADSKSTVLFHIKASYGDLVTLASFVKGDYDSRAKTSSGNSTEGSPISSLVNNVKMAYTKSDEGATVVKEEVVQVMATRTTLGTIRKNVQDANTAINTSIAGAQISVDTQVAVVGQAELDKQVAEQAYNQAKAVAEKAEADAEWHQKFAEYKPPFWLALLGGFKDQGGHGITSEKSERLIFAMQKKAAAEYDLQAFRDREKEWLERKTKLQELEAEKMKLEHALAQWKVAGSVAQQDLQQCETTITRCQEAEAVMLQCKKGLNAMLDRCTALEELVTRGDYVQTKADYVGVILECLVQGTIDSSLVEPAKTVLQALEAGDDTGLLKQEKFSKDAVVIKGLIDGFAGLSPLSRV